MAANVKWKALHIGRRTGKNVLEGKTIRKDSNGYENFNDYFSDDDDSSFNSTLGTPLKSAKSGKIQKNSPSKSRNILTPTNRKSRICRSEVSIARENKQDEKESMVCETPKNQSQMSVSRRLMTPAETTDENNDVLSIRGPTPPPDLSANEDNTSPVIGKLHLSATPTSPNKSNSASLKSPVFKGKRTSSVRVTSPQKKARNLRTLNRSMGLNATDDADCSGFVGSPMVNQENVADDSIEEPNDSQSPVAQSAVISKSNVELSDSESENEIQLVKAAAKNSKAGKKTAAISHKQNNGDSAKKGKRAKASKKTSKESLDVPDNVNSKAKAPQKQIEKKKSPIYPDEQSLSQNEDAVRRSKRTKLPRLEYWKQERPIYRRTSSGVAIVGVQSPINKQSSSETTKVPLKSSKPKSNVKNNSDDDFNQELYQGTKIINPSTGNEEIEMCIGQVDPPSYGPTGDKSSPSDSLSVTKLFVNHLFTCGCMTLKPSAEKPRSRSKEYTILYSIVRGKVEVIIHETSYTLKAGNVFVIPKANAYSIKNLQKAKAVLQYTCITGSDYSFVDSDSDDG